MAGTRKSKKGTAKKSPLAANEARCMRCKVNRVVQNPKVVTISNGRKMMKGACPVCSTKMNKFVAK